MVQSGAEAAEDTENASYGLLCACGSGQILWQPGQSVLEALMKSVAGELDQLSPLPVSKINSHWGLEK